MNPNPTNRLHKVIRRSLCLLLTTAALPAADDAWNLHNVVWSSPSDNSTGSMPLSGGELGLNVWVEGDDLLFYIGHPDSRIEDQKLVKLGRVRMSFGAPVFKINFKQELDLAESCIRITGDGVALKLWVDAFDPVVHVEMRTETPVTASIAYESWRFTAASIANGLEWVYRLDPQRSDLVRKLKQQKAEAIAGEMIDPLKNLTMGGRIIAAGLVPDGTGEGNYMKTPFKSWKAKTASPVTKLDLRVLLRVAQDDSVEAWRGALDKLQRAPSDRRRTLAWWQEFWNRSWVNINPGKTDDDGWKVGRNYQLFRYMLAANRTGKAPTLFNGGNHTFDNPLPNARSFGANGPDPDERPWWGCLFMAQNQRWVYWPMLKNGDADLMKVGLDFYRDRAPIAEAKAKLFLGTEGTLFTESLDLYSLIAACPSGNGLEAAGHLSHHFSSGLEFAFMMIEHSRFTGEDLTPSLPVVMGMLKFYDNFYQQQCLKLTGKPLDAAGRLIIYPSNSCEHGVGCTNPSEVVGGLMAIAKGLATLDIPPADRAWVEDFTRRIPPMPVVKTNGRRTIAVAEAWKSIANPNEFPQLYNLFPFHNHGVGLPDLDVAKETWKGGQPIQKEAMCWKYGNTGVAMLGLADEAMDYALKKFLWPYRGHGTQTIAHGNCAPFVPRFPAFWNTCNFDSYPDMDHGGCAMVGLQCMLLQTPGKRILLLPAWPLSWDVDFKLHAPYNTTVECEVRNGKIANLRVTPASRRADVEIIGPIAPPPLPVSQGKAASASGTWHDAGYEAAKAVDGKRETRWAAAAGTTTGWLEVDLGTVKTVTRALIDESSYPWTKQFEIQAKVDGRWVTIGAGTTLGASRELALTSTAAQVFRLNITKATRVPTIDEFQLFE